MGALQRGRKCGAAAPLAPAIIGFFRPYRPRWGSLQSSPKSPSCIKRTASKGMASKGRGQKRYGRLEKGGEEVEGGIWPPKNVGVAPPMGSTQ